MGVTRRLVLTAAVTAGTINCAPAGTATLAPGDGASLAPADEARLRLVVLPDDGIQPLLQFIDETTHTLDLYVFELNSALIEQQIAAAAKRGARVRAIVEPNPAGRADVARGAMSRLRRAGVQVKPAGKPFSATHAKVLVADGTRAWIGTANLVDDWDHRRDYAVITRQPETVRGVAQVFEDDWRGMWTALQLPSSRRIDPQSNLVITPGNGRSAITSFLAGARSSLSIEYELIEDRAILDVLGRRSREGVDVKVVVEQGEDGQRTAQALRQRSPAIQVRLLAKPAVHAKVAVADETRVLLGSQNLTRDSLDTRREIGLITDDPLVVAGVVGALRSDLDLGDGEGVPTTPGRALQVDATFLWGFAAGALATGGGALVWQLGRRRSAART